MQPGDNGHEDGTECQQVCASGVQSFTGDQVIGVMANCPHLLTYRLVFVCNADNALRSLRNPIEPFLPIPNYFGLIMRRLASCRETQPIPPQDMEHRQLVILSLSEYLARTMSAFTKLQNERVRLAAEKQRIASHQTLHRKGKSKEQQVRHVSLHDMRQVGPWAFSLGVL
jgi:hypothetical protein